MTARAIEPAFGSRRKQSTTPRFKLVDEILLGASLTTRLQDPIQRQGHRDDGEKHQTKQLRALELLAFENLVVVVRLAVCGQLDFRTDLGAA